MTDALSTQWIVNKTRGAFMAVASKIGRNQRLRRPVGKKTTNLRGDGSHWLRRALGIGGGHKLCFSYWLGRWRRIPRCTYSGGKKLSFHFGGWWLLTAECQCWIAAAVDKLWACRLLSSHDGAILVKIWHIRQVLMAISLKISSRYGTFPRCWHILKNYIFIHVYIFFPFLNKGNFESHKPL